MKQHSGRLPARADVRANGAAAQSAQAPAHRASSHLAQLADRSAPLRQLRSDAALADASPALAWRHQVERLANDSPRMLPSRQLAALAQATSAPVQRVTDETLTPATFRDTREALGNAVDVRHRSDVVDAADERFSLSELGKFLTPRHDATGWGFMVRTADAAAMQAALRARAFPGIDWELGPDGNRIRNGGAARFQVLRPVQTEVQGAPGQPALTPGDCYQACLHAMGTATPQAYFRDADGSEVTVDTVDPFTAKMALLETEFVYDEAYQQLKARYQAEHDPAMRATLVRQIDALLLAPYAALTAQQREDFDSRHGINRHVRAGEGGGYVTLTDTSSATRNFAFHAGGIVASDGNDVVTWENFANWAQDYGGAPRERTEYGVFKMYSTLPASGRTFHDQVALGGADLAGQSDARAEYGAHPITLPIRARPVLAAPAQVGPEEPIANALPGTPSAPVPLTIGDPYDPDATADIALDHFFALPGADGAAAPSGGHDALPLPVWALGGNSPVHDHGGALPLMAPYPFLPAEHNGFEPFGGNNVIPSAYPVHGGVAPGNGNHGGMASTAPDDDSWMDFVNWDSVNEDGDVKERETKRHKSKHDY